MKTYILCSILLSVTLTGTGTGTGLVYAANYRTRTQLSWLSGSVYAACDANNGPEPDDQCTGTDTCTKCSKDCLNIIQCINGVQYQLNCQQQTGKPYCDKDSLTCVEQADSCGGRFGTCPPKATGQFPDILDCRKFIFCENGQSIADDSCPTNTVYNPKTEMCLTGVPCYQFSSTNGVCRGRPNTYVAHPLDKKLYVFCTPTHPVLLMCDENGEVFDPKMAGCVFECPDIGKYPYPKDNTKYYECVKIGTSLQSTIKKCPSNWHFDEKTKKCAPRTEPSTTEENPWNPL